MNEKWTKQSDGSYTWGEFTIRKSEGHSYPWRLFHPTLIDPDKGWGNRFSTLRDAKTVAPQMLAHHEQKILVEKKAKADEICRKCRIKDTREWSPALRHLGHDRDRLYPVPETFFDDYRGRGLAVRDQDMMIANSMGPLDLKLRPAPGMNEEQLRA